MADRYRLGPAFTGPGSVDGAEEVAPLQAAEEVKRLRSRLVCDLTDGAAGPTGSDGQGYRFLALAALEQADEYLRMAHRADIRERAK